LVPKLAGAKGIEQGAAHDLREVGVLAEPEAAPSPWEGREARGKGFLRGAALKGSSGLSRGVATGFVVSGRLVGAALGGVNVHGRVWYPWCPWCIGGKP